jgi:hypothetical protein
MLAMEVPIISRDLIGNKQRIRPTLRSEMLVSFRRDLSVNDDMGDVDAVRAKLAPWIGQALAART